MSQTMLKKELRKELLRTRRNLSFDQVEIQSKQITENILKLQEYKSAYVVACYIAMPDEVQTKALVEKSWELGKKVVVPVTDAEKRKIEFYQLDNWNDLVQGAYGIWQPNVLQSLAADITKIDFVLVPGVGFDTSGNRLGFGAGYYDRFLSSLSSTAVTVGLAFECQVVQEVPIDEWDRKMDFVITENRIIQS